MADERLSKLQKWILVKCYKQRDEDFPKGIIARRQLIYMSNKITPSIEVSISRSIWSLIDKKYVTGLSPISVGDMAMIYGMQGKSKEETIKDLGKYKTKEKLTIPSIRGKKAKIIILTEKGEEQAKELLMLNSDIGRNLTIRKGNQFNVTGKKQNRRNY